MQEHVREPRVWRWLGDPSRDLQYAARILLRSPGFTLAALLSLALGIGANAALFSLVDQLLLRPLAVTDPHRLVYLIWRNQVGSSGWGSGYVMSYPLCRDLQEQRQFFDGVLCRHPTTARFSTGQEHEPVRVEIVSGQYFSVLGIGPAMGRLFDAADDLQPAGHPVVVLSHHFWKRRFAGAGDVVGRKVWLNKYPLTIIGVAPEGFSGIDPHEPPALWLPAMMTEQAANIDAYWNRLLDRRAAWLHVVARLKPGVTAEDAQVGLQPWFQSSSVLRCIARPSAAKSPMLDADARREGFGCCWVRLCSSFC